MSAPVWTAAPSPTTCALDPRREVMTEEVPSFGELAMIQGAQAAGSGAGWNLPALWPHSQTS